MSESGVRMKKSDSLIPAICPQCGANIELGKNLRIGYCSFCGTKILIKEVLKNLNSPTFENYVTLGDRAYKDNNYESALDYYSSALKINPEDWYIVYREGLSKSATGNFTHFDIKSGLDGCKHALRLMNLDKTLNAQEKASKKIQIFKDSFLIFNSYFNKVKQSMWNVEATGYVERFLKLRKAYYYLLEQILTNELIESFSDDSEKIEYINDAKVAILRKIILIDCEICNLRIHRELRKSCIKDYNLCAIKILEMNSNESLPTIKKGNPLTQEQQTILIILFVFVGYFFVLIVFTSLVLK